MLGNKVLSLLHVSVIPSEKWAVWSLRPPLAPVSWEPAALASPFPPICCQLNQPFQVWSRGLRPEAIHPYLAVDTWVHCSSFSSVGPCLQATFPGLQLLQSHTQLPPLPQGLMLDSCPLLEKESALLGGRRGSAVIFHTALCCPLLALIEQNVSSPPKMMS